MTHFATTAIDTVVAAATARAAFAAGTPWTPADAAEVNATDLSLLPVLEIIIAAEHFVYDSTDTSSAHDPEGGVLVSGDGVRRYISAVAPAAFTNVLDLLNAQPSSPTIGDRYATAAAPTGADWSGNANKLTVYTSAGWRFATPAIGQRVFDRSAQADIQMTEAGTWATADTAADSIGATELAFPFGASVEAEQDKPPAALVGQGVGSAIGDMTANGGLAAAFDGDDDQAAASAAGRASAADGYAGRVWPTAHEIEYFRFAPSNDEGFVSGGPSSITLEIYARASGTQANSTDGTQIGTLGAFADLTTEVFVGVNDTTDYLRAWGRLVPDSSGNIHLAEVEAYESTLPAAGTLYLVASGGIGKFAGQDGKVAEADGNGGWTFHAPYEGAVVYDENANLARRYDGSSWVNAAGAYIGRAAVTTLSGSQTGINGSFYSPSPSAPTTSNEAVRDNASIEYQAASANSELEFVYDVELTGGTSSAVVTIGLFRDDEVTAIAWRPLGTVPGGTLEQKMVTFNVAAEDTLEHEYHIRAIINSTTDANRPTLISRTFILREAA